jgi:hypothetical protein
MKIMKTNGRDFSLTGAITEDPIIDQVIPLIQLLGRIVE